MSRWTRTILRILRRLVPSFSLLASGRLATRSSLVGRSLRLLAIWYLVPAARRVERAACVVVVLIALLYSWTVMTIFACTECLLHPVPLSVDSSPPFIHRSDVTVQRYTLFARPASAQRMTLQLRSNGRHVEIGHVHVVGIRFRLREPPGSARTRGGRALQHWLLQAVAGDLVA
jgi:hypothetical protein